MLFPFARKVTVPAGVPTAIPPDVVTVAVRVTFASYEVVATDDLSVVVVAALRTLCDKAADVLEA